MPRRTSLFLIVLVVSAASSPSNAQPLAAGAPVHRRAAERESSGALPLAVDRARIAQLDTVLPILDDMGEVITEEQIKGAMRTGNTREFLFGALGFVLGAFLFESILPSPENGADCSIYEPCTDREKYYGSTGVIAGGVVGALVLGFLPDYGRDRYAAVEYIRALRRAPGVPR